MSENRGPIIQGLDIIDMLGYVSRNNKKYQATVLNLLEEVLDKDTEEYKQIRKIFLDAFNNYTRSTLKLIFGNIESLIK